MAGITLRLAEEDPATRLRAENVILVLKQKNIRSILLRSSSTERQLAKVAKRWQHCSVHRQFVLIPRTHGSPVPTDCFPYCVHFIPVLGIFLAQPLALIRNRQDEVEPQSSAVRVSAGVDHVMVGFEFFEDGLPEPRS